MQRKEDDSDFEGEVKVSVVALSQMCHFKSGEASSPAVVDKTRDGSVRNLFFTFTSVHYRQQNLLHFSVRD